MRERCYVKEIVLIMTLVANTTVTAYRSVPQQTDSSPSFTSTGEKTLSGGAAISRDLLCGACRRLHHRCKHPEYAKRLHYGDWLYARSIGFLRVNDVMGAYTTERVKNRHIKKPIYQHVDVWVPALSDEKAFHRKWKGQAVELYKAEIKEPIK